MMWSLGAVLELEDRFVLIEIRDQFGINLETKHIYLGQYVDVIFLVVCKVHFWLFQSAIGEWIICVFHVKSMATTEMKRKDFRHSEKVAILEQNNVSSIVFYSISSI